MCKISPLAQLMFDGRAERHVDHGNGGTFASYKNSAQTHAFLSSAHSLWPGCPEFVLPQVAIHLVVLDEPTIAPQLVDHIDR